MFNEISSIQAKFHIQAPHHQFVDMVGLDDTLFSGTCCDPWIQENIVSKHLNSEGNDFAFRNAKNLTENCIVSKGEIEKNIENHLAQYDGDSSSIYLCLITLRGRHFRMGHSLWMMKLVHLSQRGEVVIIFDDRSPQYSNVGEGGLGDVDMLLEQYRVVWNNIIHHLNFNDSAFPEWHLMSNLYSGEPETAALRDEIIDKLKFAEMVAFDVKVGFGEGFAADQINIRRAVVSTCLLGEKIQSANSNSCCVLVISPLYEPLFQHTDWRHRPEAVDWIPFKDKDVVHSLLRRRVVIPPLYSAYRFYDDDNLGLGGNSNQFAQVFENIKNKEEGVWGDLVIPEMQYYFGLRNEDEGEIARVFSKITEDRQRLSGVGLLLAVSGVFGSGRLEWWKKSCIFETMAILAYVHDEGKIVLKKKNDGKFDSIALGKSLNWMEGRKDLLETACKGLVDAGILIASGGERYELSDSFKDGKLEININLKELEWDQQEMVKMWEEIGKSSPLKDKSKIERPKHSTVEVPVSDNEKIAKLFQEKYIPLENNDKEVL